MEFGLLESGGEAFVMPMLNEALPDIEEVKRAPPAPIDDVEVLPHAEDRPHQRLVAVFKCKCGPIHTDKCPNSHSKHKQRNGDGISCNRISQQKGNSRAYTVLSNHAAKSTRENCGK